MKEPPEKSCARCCWWRPNQGAVIEKSEDKICHEPHQTLPWTDDEFVCDYWMGKNATEVNVPQHTPNGTMELKNATPVDGPVEILIVTYSQDFDWLVWCLRAIRKHITGFQGVTIAFPVHQSPQFNTLKDQFDVRLHPYQEWLGKGFLHHECKMGLADVIVPKATKYVMHLDSDCIYKMATTPEDYFFNDKPQYFMRTWESLWGPSPHDPTQKVVSDCIMWKDPTSAQLGYTSDVYTMCRHPTIYPVSFYPLYRTHIEKTHHMSFEDYFRSGQRNSHPQDRMDFTAMGQFAWTFMRENFHWINCASEEYPLDRQKAYHSHSGFNPDIIRELESFTN